MLLCIASNDPDTSMVELPLSVTVAEPHDLPVESFYLSSTGQEPPDSVTVGDTIAYRAYAECISGKGYVVNGETEWSSSDQAIATVNDVGEVTGVAEGRATITADYEGWEESVTVYVHDEEAAPRMVVEPESLEFDLVQGGREDFHPGDIVAKASSMGIEKADAGICSSCSCVKGGKR